MPDDSAPKTAPGVKNNRVVNAEVLSEGQRRAVDRYLSLSGSPGVLVGAHKGSAPWDIRPLILDGAVTYVLRFSDPNLALDKPRYEWLSKSLKKYPNLISGEGQGQLWVKRQYFKNTLADSPDVLNSSMGARSSWLISLIDELEAIHNLGLVHGNVVLSNLAIVDGAIKLVDAGFAAAARVAEPSAQSQRSKWSPPTVGADISGFTKIVRDFLGREITPELQKLLTKIASSDLKKSGGLMELRKHLAATSSTSQKTPTTEHGSNSKPVISEPLPPSGKVIKASQPSSKSEISAPKPLGVRLQDEPKRPERHTVLVPKDLVNEARKGEGTSSGAPKLSEATQAPEKIPEVPANLKQDSERPATITKNHSDKASARGRGRVGLPKIASRRHALAAVVFALVTAILLVRFLDIPELIARKRYNIPVTEYWRSGQASLMQQVAEAAVNGRDSAARAVILESANKRENIPSARLRILRFAFDNRWEQSLTDRERDVAFALALAPLYPDGLDKLPQFESLTPLMILAVMGDLPLDRDVATLKNLTPENLKGLPDILMQIVEGALPAGVTSLNDRSIRSLAHMITGDPSEEAFRSFFNLGEPRERLRALLPIIASNSEIGAPLYDFLANGSTLVGDYLKWFRAEEIAQWEAVSPRIRLFIAAGQIPPSGLTLEQYGDLLSFPEQHIRERTKEIILTSFLAKEWAGTIAFLTKDSNQLGRFQTVALIASFKLDPDSYYTFLTRWFEGNPEPSSVLRLLLARSNITGIDPLNFQAATYLKRTQWEATLNELTTLSQHPEGLARALAYSKLDPANPNEREVLREALKKEPNDSFRDELARRLSPAP